MRAIQFRLLLLAAAVVTLYAAALTISPAARAQSWEVDFRRDHWLGWLAWLGVYAVIHRQARRLRGHDPLLIPLLALLTGWGLMTIWRLDAGLGLRQSAWLVVSGGLFTLGLRLSPQLDFLRRYKYLALSAGLLLTAATLIFGANPLGYGPRLWLGCCGLYFQPSEPLKLLLVIYLAAYLAEKLPPANLPLLAPTLVMTTLALALMLAQRDLGTASILLFLYATIIYVATGQWRVLAASLVSMALAGLAGYALFDVVRLRVEAWLNPWLDPSGRSYQIVQSLLAVANGGLLGRGPGMGSPGFVPVAHSDFIFAAIAEEGGLVGVVLLLGILLILAQRGIRLALGVGDPFRRLLAAGLTAYLIAQGVLIIGGNVRLLPLTGVTLPLVSYGGSSLLISFVALLLMIKISEQGEEDHLEETAGRILQRPAPMPFAPQPYRHLALLLFAGLTAVALVSGWWAYVRGPALLTRTDNPRRALSDRFVRRGSLLDRNNVPLAESAGQPGELIRRYHYPALSPLLGYTHPVYGQAGLEASLDPYLRGLQGNSGLTIWWNHLLYGQPPPGLAVRLSLDHDLQQAADELLGRQAGAVVLLNAETGEILALASHPTFDANQLDQLGEALLADPTAPLFNRATLGLYPVQPLLRSLLVGTDVAPQTLGLYTPPAIGAPTAAGTPQDVELRASPLQMALVAAALTNRGLSPAPQLVLAVDTPQAGWVLLPETGPSTPIFQTAEAAHIVDSLTGENSWQCVITVEGEKPLTWFVGGTLPDWQGAPLTIVVLLEGGGEAFAGEIGDAILQAAGMAH